MGQRTLMGQAPSNEGMAVPNKEVGPAQKPARQLPNVGSPMPLTATAVKSELHRGATMKISRHGFAAYYGESSIEFTTPEIDWNSADSCIRIKQLNLRDFSNSSHHNYTVQLSLAEIQEILQVISNAVFSEPQTFEKGLESSMKSLARIQAVVAGLAK